VLALALLLVGGAAPRSALAGGGPEGVFLVVNVRSWASMAVANHYIKLRQIPQVNVLYLDWSGPIDKINSDDFRQKILGLVFATMRQRLIMDQIDSIVYSSDFPYAVDFKNDVTSVKLPPNRTPTGSLTSLTYFAPELLSGDYNFIAANGNFYMRRPAEGSGEITSHGFRGWFGFGPQGQILEAGGQHYITSAMLGYTSGVGNSVAEAKNYLSRAANADGTKPKGTIYFAQTSDIRSLVRVVNDPNSAKLLTQLQIDPAKVGFAGASAELTKLGVNAEIVNGVMPMGKADVQGTTMGTRNFSWNGSKSSLLPGAIGDNLTSFGGVFSQRDQGDTPQTVLSEYLRYGAAAASGAVVEPYADPSKFPLAYLHVHYARGCSLLEAFYQSVYCPYQLLIVGDPLCRPWANIPKITVEGIQPDATVKGPLRLSPRGTVEGGATVDRFQAFVDGVRLGGCVAGETLDLDTMNLPDGPHELRVVGIESSPIESQGRVIVPFVVANGDHTIEFTASLKDKMRWGDTVSLKAQSPGAKKITLLWGTNPLKTVDGERAEMGVDGRVFGTGTIALQAMATHGDTPNEHVLSRVIELSVEPSPAMPGRKLKAGAKQPIPGMQVTPSGSPTVIVPRTDDGKWLTAAGVKPDGAFELAAIFEVPADDVYQFQAYHQSNLSIEVDGTTIYNGDEKQAVQRYAPVSLGRGLHALKIRGSGNQPKGLDLRFGGQGTQYLDGRVFRHPG
jgi:hypothetical protein